jgi:hypothetical protein
MKYVILSIIAVLCQFNVYAQMPPTTVPMPGSVSMASASSTSSNPFSSYDAMGRLKPLDQLNMLPNPSCPDDPYCHLRADPRISDVYYDEFSGILNIYTREQHKETFFEVLGRKIKILLGGGNIVPQSTVAGVRG